MNHAALEIHKNVNEFLAASSITFLVCCQVGHRHFLAAHEATRHPTGHDAMGFIPRSTHQVTCAAHRFTSLQRKDYTTFEHH